MDEEDKVRYQPLTYSKKPAAFPNTSSNETSKKDNVDKSSKRSGELGKEDHEVCVSCGHITKIGVKKRKIEDLEHQYDVLHSKLLKLQETFDRQEAMLMKILVNVKRMSDHIIPTKIDLNIFPLQSLDQLRSFELEIPTIDTTNLIKYIKQTLKNIRIEKTINFLFTDDVLMQVNWDGHHNKFALSKTQLFGKYVFDAIQKDNMTFQQYESNMRRGFRNAKNKHYRKNASKQSSNKNETNFERLEEVDTDVNGKFDEDREKLPPVRAGGSTVVLANSSPDSNLFVKKGVEDVEIADVKEENECDFEFDEWSARFEYINMKVNGKFVGTREKLPPVPAGGSAVVVAAASPDRESFEEDSEEAAEIIQVKEECELDGGEEAEKSI